MQKNTDLQGCPFGSMLDNNKNMEKKLKDILKDTKKYKKMDLKGC